MLSLVWTFSNVEAEPQRPAEPQRRAEPKQQTERPSIGILADPRPAEGEQGGVIIRDVTPDSPAAKAGLKQGDVIDKIGDKQIKSFDDLVNTLASRKVGEKLTFHVRRSGKDESVEVTLGQRLARRFGEGSRNRASTFLGVQSRDLTPELKQKADAQVDAGALIVEVVPDTPAAKAGVREGDVITSFNGQPVSNSEDLRRAVRETGMGKEVTLKVARGKETKELKTQLEESPADVFSIPLPRFENRERPQARPQELEQLQSKVLRNKYATPIRAKRFPGFACDRDKAIRLEGFEPPTYGSVGRCSIQLSYRRDDSSWQLFRSIGSPENPVNLPEFRP
jgi:membrane-associated protease RseP (regulator of RpoE activity)